MRHRALSAAVAVASCMHASPAAGDAPARRVELGASLGYGLPLGDAERGSRVSDTTFGDLLLAVDAGYRLTRRVGIAVHAHYGIAIPTLCATASDCEASLGSDVGLELVARFYPPRMGPFAPLVDVGMGYEWLTTRLVDSGAESSRSYSGPVFVAARLVAPVALGERWSLGPVLDGSYGTFTSFGLRTTAQSFSGDVPWRSPHAWLSFGIRAGVVF
ncbi:MAG TPA: hypothetical protein VF765_32890 [Polyangiaceae bacterium]